MSLFPEWLEANKEEIKLPEKIKVMRARFGKRNDHKCKECAHLILQGKTASRYFKCEMNRITRGPGTDWRANWPACGKFEKGIKDE